MWLCGTLFAEYRAFFAEYRALLADNTALFFVRRVSWHILVASRYFCTAKDRALLVENRAFFFSVEYRAFFEHNTFPLIRTGGPVFAIDRALLVENRAFFFSVEYRAFF